MVLRAYAVVEGAKVGGSCVNYGCTPTKALVASARAIHMARRGEEFGFSAGEVKVDYARVRERMNAIRNDSNQGLTEWMAGTDNVTLIRGWAKFVDDNVVAVGDRRIQAKRVYVNVGTRPVVPAIRGLDDVPWIDSAGMLDLETLPRHLVVVGGGYIGVEFAQVYRRFGTKVTVLQRESQLMPREDADVAQAIEDVLTGEGVEVYTDTDIDRVERAGDGVVKVYVKVKGEARIIEGSHLLLAAGRRSNADRLELGNTSIRTDERGFVDVDDVCRTGADGVFAVGDVNGHGAFTHTAVNDAEIVLDHLFGGERRLSSRIQIYGLFTDPPLGRVGMSRKEALASKRRVLEATRSMKRISRAKEMSETDGFARLLVDGETDQILGASILGPGADEIVNMFAAIMHSQIPCHEYRRVVLVHPTVAELMPWILDGIAEAREKT